MVKLSTATLVCNRLAFLKQDITMPTLEALLEHADSNGLL